MNLAYQAGTVERESFSFTRGIRAIGKALGVPRMTALRMAHERVIPAVLLRGKWTLIPAVATYASALAQILLRRERSLCEAPRGGGLVPGSCPAASTPSRCKKMSPKEFEGPVVTLE